MKTFTVKQPWAYLVCAGIKDIENRTWKTNFRGRVLIHASAQSDRSRTPLLSMAQFARTGYQAGYQSAYFGERSAIIGSVEIVDCVQNHSSIWAEKDFYNWVLANPIMFEKPIEGVKGKLSFWEYDLQEEPKHAPIYMRHHTSINLDGILRNYGKRSLDGFFLDDNGGEMSNKECRQYIAECRAKGWKKLPMCDESDCPDFDHLEKGCPGHRITKEEYEREPE